MTGITVRTPAGYAEERRYIADVVLGEFLGLHFELLQISDLDHVELTVDDGSARRVVLPDALFSTPRDHWLAPSSLPRRPLGRVDLRGTPLEALVTEHVLPLVFAAPAGVEPPLAESPAEVSLSVDVFGSAFFMLTRYEELVKPDRDERGRFPVSASLAMQEGFLHRALINEYVELLWWALRRLWPRLERAQREFTEAPTHDVDVPFCVRGHSTRSVVRTVAGDVALRADPILALERSRSLFLARTRSPEADLCFKAFEYLMACSERHGLTSTFNFMSHVAGQDHGGDYSITDPYITALLRRIDERQHAIGFHPSYETYQDAQRVRFEFAELRRACRAAGVTRETWGGRQHFLRWDNPTTWQAWNDAGLTWDSSLGLSQGAGFRCGVCYEYPVFNLLTRKALALRERPLIVMDSALLGNANRNVEGVRETILALKATCRRFKGDFTSLWHNNRMASRKVKGLYEEVLAA
jgi:hypothetical protein